MPAAPWARPRRPVTFRPPAPQPAERARACPPSPGRAIRRALAGPRRDASPSTWACRRARSSPRRSGLSRTQAGDGARSMVRSARCAQGNILHRNPSGKNPLRGERRKRKSSGGQWHRAKGARSPTEQDSISPQAQIRLCNRHARSRRSDSADRTRKLNAPNPKEFTALTIPGFGDAPCGRASALLAMPLPIQTSLPRGLTLAILVNHISWNSLAARMPDPLFSYLLGHDQRLQNLHCGAWNLNSSPPRAKSVSKVP